MRLYSVIRCTLLFIFVILIPNTSFFIIHFLFPSFIFPPFFIFIITIFILLRTHHFHQYHFQASCQSLKTTYSSKNTQKQSISLWLHHQVVGRPFVLNMHLSKDTTYRGASLLSHKLRYVSVKCSFHQASSSLPPSTYSLCSLTVAYQAISSRRTCIFMWK